jgi:antitoxin CcdA
MRIQCAFKLLKKRVALKTSPSNSRTKHKRAVNLTLSDELVNQTKLYSSNLSATVEKLLINYVDEQSKSSLRKVSAAKQLSAQWNLVNDQIGSFADEYSNL